MSLKVILFSDFSFIPYDIYQNILIDDVTLLELIKELNGILKRDVTRLMNVVIHNIHMYVCTY